MTQEVLLIAWDAVDGGPSINEVMEADDCYRLNLQNYRYVAISLLGAVSRAAIDAALAEQAVE